MNEESILMDCAWFEEILPDLNRPRTRGMALRESALAHAESCPRCARLLAEAESLDQALLALAAEETGLQAPAHIEANLLREFRRQKVAVSRRGIRWRAVIGIAAAILLAFGLSLRHRLALPSGSGSVTQTPSEGAALPPATNSAERSAPVAIEPQASVSAAPEKRQQSSHSALSNEQGDSDEAAAFIPLPYADDPASVDEGAVIRVVLSRAALASFGFAEEPEASDDPVSADLLVSEDGTPQAIRLVSQQRAGGEF